MADNRIPLTINALHKNMGRRSMVNSAALELSLWQSLAPV